MRKNDLEQALGKLELMIKLSQMAFDELYCLVYPEEKSKIKKVRKAKKSKVGRPRKSDRNEATSK